MHRIPEDEEASWAHSDASSQLSSWTSKQAMREKNISLRRIFEEASTEYVGDAKTDAELADYTQRAVNLRKARVQDVVKQMQAAKHLDLCFMVDVTGSMGPHIQAVKNQIEAIVNKLTAIPEVPAVPGRASVLFAPIVKKIRLAFVGYRDFGDSRQFEVLDFCDSVALFKAFCHLIQAYGGGDIAEDIFGGLEECIALNWSTDGSTRVLFHIADAPCHGIKYHDITINDRYPRGDPKGRSIKRLLGELANKDITYHFGKITNYTDKMIGKFSEIYGDEIVTCDIKNDDHLLNAITSTTSMAVSKVAGPSAAGRHQFAAGLVYDRNMPNWNRCLFFLPKKIFANWNGIIKTNGIFFSYELPSSLADVFSGLPLKPKQTVNAIVQLAPKPFAKGVERVAYYGRDVTSAANPIDIVLKKYVSATGFLNSPLHYEGAIQLQTIAAYLASNFSATILEKVGRGYAIKFLKSQVFSYKDATTGRKVYMSSECLYPVGCDYLRFSNNFDYSMLEETAKTKGVDLKFVEQLMAFSHWTYQISHGYLMVVDLQGIINTDGAGKKSIELTDPAIHCTDLIRFGRTNLGKTGMKSFFSRHICNEVCKKMGLTVPTNFGDADD